MIRKILVAAVLAAPFGSIATPATAEIITPATAKIIVRAAPPPPRAEAAPPSRRGQLWIAGHWEWKNNRHQWVTGTWVRERRGYQYTQPTWVRCDTCWYMQPGNWRPQDRDGDGVLNRQDRAPNNPKRY